MTGSSTSGDIAKIITIRENGSRFVSQSSSPIFFEFENCLSLLCARASRSKMASLVGWKILYISKILWKNDVLNQLHLNCINESTTSLKTVIYRKHENKLTDDIIIMRRESERQRQRQREHAARYFGAQKLPRAMMARVGQSASSKARKRGTRKEKKSRREV